MDSKVQYMSDYENHPPCQLNYHKRMKYHFSRERFVVPWQMDEYYKELEDAE